MHIPMTMGTGMASSLGTGVISSLRAHLSVIGGSLRTVRFRTRHVLTSTTGISTADLATVHRRVSRRGGGHLTFGRRMATGLGSTGRLSLKARVPRNALRRAIAIGVKSGLSTLVNTRVLLRSNGVITFHRW